MCTPTYFDAFSNVDEEPEQELTCPDDCTNPEQGKYFLLDQTPNPETTNPELFFTKFVFFGWLKTDFQIL